MPVSAVALGFLVPKRCLVEASVPSCNSGKPAEDRTQACPPTTGSRQLIYEPSGRRAWTRVIELLFDHAFAGSLLEITGKRCATCDLVLLITLGYLFNGDDRRQACILIHLSFTHAGILFVAVRHAPDSIPKSGPFRLGYR